MIRLLQEKSFGSHGSVGIRVDAATLGTLLLRVYELARSDGVEAFQHQVIALLSELIAFDGAWWGRSIADGKHLHVNCSYLYNLPEDTPERLNSSDPGNVFAWRSTETPDRAHQFFASDFRDHASTAALNEHIGCAQTICITRFDPASQLASFLALMRSRVTPAFEKKDRDLLEMLMPHLAASLDLCCTSQMARLRRGSGEAMLTTDDEGWIHVSEPAVRGLICREWPGWAGPRLPSTLVDLIARKVPAFLGQHVRADVLSLGRHVLVTLRLREPRDSLTRQECAVADCFAFGHSYKEVADQLQLAPATVRHYLRKVYRKLGVADKAALARAMRPNANRSSGGPDERTKFI